MNSRGVLVSTSPWDPTDVVAELPLDEMDDLGVKVSRLRDQWAERATLPESTVAGLSAVANRLRADADRLAELTAREVGKPVQEAGQEVRRAAAIFDFYSQRPADPVGETYRSLVKEDRMLFSVREALGVVAIICPWNFPWAIPSWKIAPALAYGNAVVFKPATEAGGIGQELTTILREEGLPIEIAVASGRVAESALVDNPEVAAVSFTGSRQVGHRVRGRAAARGAKVQVELGGKNATVISESADPEWAAGIVARASMGYAGQKCTATSRVVLPDHRYSEFLEPIIAAVENLRVDDPRRPETDVGPVINRREAERIVSEVKGAISSGAKLLAGSTAPRGALVTPCVLDDLDSTQGIFQEEVFGPVLAVTGAAGLGEAIDIVNGVRYGLCASILTADLGEALEFSRRAKVGVVKVNSESAGLEYHVPFGGWKESGSHSPEQGTAAKDFYTEVKTIYLEPPAGTRSERAGPR